jgi:hypothetical protein
LGGGDTSPLAPVAFSQSFTLLITVGAEIGSFDERPPSRRGMDPWR